VVRRGASFRAAQNPPDDTGKGGDVKLRLIAGAVALAALCTAGLAVARTIDAGTVAAATATFNATSATNVRTTKCTNADGAWTEMRGRWSGMAVSTNASLNGPITLDVHALVNTTKGLGTVTGSLSIRTASGRRTTAQFDAVYAGGKVAGLAKGHAPSSSRLVANISAELPSTGGFLNGKLGATDSGQAIILGPGHCRPPQPAKAEARGPVTGLTPTSITVGGLTCSITPALAAKIAALGVAVGSNVHIRCENGVLVSISKRK
jgi:hypothetical protein